jgi:hypothetical protein
MRGSDLATGITARYDELARYIGYIKSYRPLLRSPCFRGYVSSSSRSRALTCQFCKKAPQFFGNCNKALRSPTLTPHVSQPPPPPPPPLRPSLLPSPPCRSPHLPAPACAPRPRRPHAGGGMDQRRRRPRPAHLGLDALT